MIYHVNKIDKESKATWGLETQKHQNPFDRNRKLKKDNISVVGRMWFYYCYKCLKYLEQTHGHSCTDSAEICQEKHKTIN